MNSVYGKTIENLMDRDIIKICRTKEELLQHCTKSNYKRHIIISDELVVVCLRQNYVYFTKPFYIGFSILEIAKTLMFDFYYNVLKKFYESDISLLYHDTDSFLIKVKSNELSSDLETLAQVFDFSNLPTDHKLFDKSRRAQLFLFKEELGFKPILRYIGLASKVYCLQTVCCHKFNVKNPTSCNCTTDVNCLNVASDKAVCKGASNRAVSDFTFKNYLRCLETQVPEHVTDFRIVSKRQKISTLIVRKIAMSGFDDKRYILNCGIHSVPFSENNTFQCFAEECTNHF